MKHIQELIEENARLKAELAQAELKREMYAETLHMVAGEKEALSQQVASARHTLNQTFSWLVGMNMQTRQKREISGWLQELEKALSSSSETSALER